MVATEHIITIVPDEAYLHSFWRAWLHAHGRSWVINLAMIGVFAVGGLLGVIWCLAADAGVMLYVPAFMLAVATFEGAKHYWRRRAWFAEARRRLTPKGTIRFVLRDGLLTQTAPEPDPDELLDGPFVVTVTPEGAILRVKHDPTKGVLGLSQKSGSLYLPLSAWEPSLSSSDLAGLLNS